MTEKTKLNSQFPVPCETCQREIMEDIEESQKAEVILKYCYSNQILVIANGLDGKFLNWNMQGPMTWDQAVLTIEQAQHRIAKASNSPITETAH